MKRSLFPGLFTVLMGIAVLGTCGCFESLDQGVPPQIDSPASAISVEGRVFYYAVPSAPPRAGGYPVVLCFHGGDGSGRMWVDYTGIGLSGFGNLALASGYFVVAPDAGISDDPSGSYSDVKKRWDTSQASGDVPYIISVLEWLGSSGYPVNMNRVFGVGISSGGAMISRLCQGTPWMFRRAAIVASINPNYGYIPATQVVSPAHPSVMFVQGDADPLTPWARAQDYYNALTFLNAYLTVAAAGSDPTARVFITVSGGGHTWFRDYNDDIITWFENAP